MKNKLIIGKRKYEFNEMENSKYDMLSYNLRGEKSSHIFVLGRTQLRKFKAWINQLDV